MRERLRGEYRLTLSIQRGDGEPAAGRTFALSYILLKFDRNWNVSEGIVPEDGLVELEQLAEEEYLELVVDGKVRGGIPIEGDQTELTETIVLASGVGDPAPDFPMTDLKTGEEFQLSDLKGQVVLIEFWASWCWPCQAPMKHNDELMARRADDWRGKATILGVSIDTTIEMIQRHVDQRDWHSVRQVHIDGAYESEAARKYRLGSIPSVFLVDAAGTIVFVGHPSEIDVEAEISKLLGV